MPLYYMGLALPHSLTHSQTAGRLKSKQKGVMLLEW